MRLLAISCAFLLSLHNVDCFTATPPAPGSTKTGGFASSTELFMGKSRKARRQQKVEKQGKSRPQQFFEAIEDAADTKKETDKNATAASADPAEGEREARMAEAQRRMDERPDVSTLIVDDETGIEIVAQGKAVMDVVTRKAVKLSDLGPEYRLAQMFPGVPPDIRDELRMDWKTVEVPQMVEILREACSVALDDGSVGIPKHPSVANKAIDFVLANRDYLGYNMKRTLGRLEMRSMWKGNVEEARENRALWRNFLTLENHISAPFRQIMLDGEGRVGPNFGNLDLTSFCSGELYERVANYLVLKGMVAHWEKKVKDANYVENTPQTEANFMTVLSTGDPRRYLPDPPILYTLKECTQVCLMAQQMCKAFVDTEELFADFPPELRFLEKALTIQGGSALRKFMIEDFCPAEGITQAALCEGMRRLYEQLSNMQIDPYGDLTNIIERLMKAMEVGTDGARDPYAVYLANIDQEGPGFFQTYTFNHDQLSLVRFLDQQYERDGAGGGVVASQPSSMGLQSLFGFAEMPPPQPKMSDDETPRDTGDVYRVPEARACRRPHELGWLEMLDGDQDPNERLGKIPPGQIIQEA
ncbi:expressed unknown protein [Seminavis robusta]|uniref:Uncharacterized protein n=1 Tax=Seminavis robusta TaxID=568900 RepID=A0A9N8DNJ9_9STRA|nr:expressed unknown protein [Seminavis robusta]|eukprot:Sro245_g097350.1 n/a (587) ;mRNA; f:29950-31815